MDGTLIDSESRFIESFTETCQQHQIEINERLIYDCYGCNETLTRAIYLDHFKDEHFVDRFLNDLYLHHEKLMLEQDLPLMEGALELLEWLQSNNIALALATSTSSHIAIERLKKVHLDLFFKVMTFGDQVKCSKPDPEIYLQTAQKLNVAPNHCLALEDSNNGAKSAYQAGMVVIQIPNLIETKDVQQTGRRVIPSLKVLVDELKAY